MGASHFRLEEFVVRQADEQDIPSVFSLLSKTIRWLESRGLKQWPRYSVEWVAGEIQSGAVYVADCEGTVVGMMRLFTSDPDVWPEGGQNAIYVHTLAVDHDMKGDSIGLRMLEWVEVQAREQGVKYLRLDCVAENEKLCRYYEDAGFDAVDVVWAWGRPMRRFQLAVV
ncbi:putative N-acetyltransferase YesJ [Litchfieldella qijiaojingensis]|uniref:N-acetyltransferase YesJ n=1 Tax=Litchfieldella qijiaojingensis TaxID=980347 RepID=A0ABQ2YX67_9GAMM|nr:GNAT family N-acetyltransferase [Halomonas qijiaojingensis]GGX96853.1 putative N-acetyltransferase YesJ [Halomonas qijiaojingensis]